MASPSVGMAWLGAIGYTLHIYYDFSAYSDMAIGLGEMLGFHFLENFNYPYISKTITEFWRRWHISLGSWFRDYVYFPMGGSRVKTKRRLVLNLMVVWMLTGIWHGANWTFIIWGLINGVIIVIEKLTNLPKKIDTFKLPARIPFHILTMLIIIIGWVFFNSSGIDTAATYVASMFGLHGAALTDSTFVFNLHEYRFMLVLGVLFSMPVIPYLKEKCAGKFPKAVSVGTGVFDIAQIALFLVSVSCLVMNAHNPFIYFNF